jgi:hypothetical protein
MTVRLLAAAIAVSLGSLAASAQDHPFKNVKVDEFATYKMKVSVATTSGTLNLEGTTTQTVISKTDKEAKVRIVANFGGMETPPQEQTIDLSKPYDPTRVGQLQPGTEAKIDKLKDGKEKVKAGKDNKEYDCTTTVYKMKAKAAGQEIDGEVKVWEAKDAPMGLVKMEMTGTVAGMKTTMTMELIESGTKKVP